MKNRKIFLLLLFVFILDFSVLLQKDNTAYIKQEDMGTKYFLPNLSSSNSISEVWNRTWGGFGDDRGYALAIDSSDNIYIAGSTGRFGVIKEDMVLVKYDNSGVQQWNRTWGGSDSDIGLGVVIDSSDNIYIVGGTCSFGAENGDICLIKYDSSGVLQWNRTWGGIENDWGNAIALDSSENIYLAGSIANLTSSYSDMCLVKYDSSGVQLWNRTWGGISDDKGNALVIDSSDNIYLAGYTWSFGAGGSDFCLVKYNSNGDYQWNRTWGGFHRDNSYSVSLDPSDNIYLSGETGSFGVGAYDYCLIKYNSNGDYQWNCTWGGIESELCYAMTLDSSNNIYLTGRIIVDVEPYFNSDICLVKFDSSGKFQWNYTWGGIGEDRGNALAIDSSDNIYIGGSTEYFDVIKDEIVLLKIPNPSITTIPSYDLFIFLSTISVVSIILIRNRHKLHN